MDGERVNGNISLSPVESSLCREGYQEILLIGIFANIVAKLKEKLQHVEQMQTRHIVKILAHCARQIIAHCLRNTNQTERENSCTLLEEPDTPRLLFGLAQKSALFCPFIHIIKI